MQNYGYPPPLQSQNSGIQLFPPGNGQNQQGNLNYYNQFNNSQQPINLPQQNGWQVNGGSINQGFNPNQGGGYQNQAGGFNGPPQNQFGQYPNQYNFPDQYIPSNDEYQQQMMMNQQMAAGFGGMFFNMADPNFDKRNTPVKQGSSWHINAFVSTFFIIPGLVVLILSIINIIPSIIAGIVVMVVCYFIHVIGMFCCSSIRSYIYNLKKFQDYKDTFDKMVAGRGYFRFWIECYHYRTTRTKKGGTRRTKVVTHTATQNYYPTQSFDESGKLEGIADITRYVFINYLRKFYFIDQRSNQIFDRAYKDFVLRNTRDSYQNYTHTFDIENFEEYVGFTQGGAGCHNLCLFILFNMIGLGLPYALIMERNISRYEINIVKRLACM